MSSLHRWTILSGVLLFSGLIGCSGSNISTAVVPVSTTPVGTAKAKFAYTGNQGQSISGFSVDTSNGALTPLSGFPIPLGYNPTVVAHDPQNRFLLVADIASSLLYVFAFNSTTGALTLVAPSPYNTVREPVAVTTDPTGTHVYVASQYGNLVGAFSLSASGVLTPITGAPFASAGTSTSASVGSGIVTDPAGKFLYLLDLVNLYTFSIDATSGALTLLQTISGPRAGNAIAMDSTATYIYAVGSGTNSILTYSIAPTTGLLTQTKTSPMAKQNGAYTIALAPNGQFAYTIEANNSLVTYQITNGIMTPLSTIYSGVYGEQIAIDPSSSFVYVPQACSNCPSGVYNVVHEFTIGSTGALTKLSGSPVPAGTTPWGITLTTQ